MVGVMRSRALSMPAEPNPRRLDQIAGRADRRRRVQLDKGEHVAVAIERDPGRLARRELRLDRGPALDHPE